LRSFLFRHARNTIPKQSFRACLATHGFFRLGIVFVIRQHYDNYDNFASSRVTVYCSGRDWQRYRTVCFVRS
jgi:hypothetical protein